MYVTKTTVPPKIIAVRMERISKHIAKQHHNIYRHYFTQSKQLQNHVIILNVQKLRRIFFTHTKTKTIKLEKQSTWYVIELSVYNDSRNNAECQYNNVIVDLMTK